MILEKLKNIEKSINSELSSKINNATIVIIICDRGDRYISTGIYDMKSN